MKRIPLTHGYFALVDDDDYEELSKHKWHYHEGYACRNSDLINGRRKTLRMHREIIHAPQGIGTDHIDGNKLNNQKSNLRTATQSQNNANTSARNNTSKYKGVSIRNNHWRSQIRFNGKTKSLGTYRTEEEAAKAYDVKAKELFGEYARLNFGGTDNG